MKIENKTNICFKANFQVIKTEDLPRPIIQKIAPYFKNCGCDLVTHELKTDDTDKMSAMVLTTFRAEKHKAFQTFKRLDLSDTDIIFKKVKEIKNWVEDRKIQAGL